MKNIIFLLCTFLIGFAAQAQQPTVPGGSGSWNNKAMDTTISGSGTPSVVIPVIGNKQAVTFQYSITKNSGTVAGTITLLGSIDGGATYATINTYTLTDATFSTSLTYFHAGYNKYKITVSATATQNANYKIWALYRQ